MPNYSFNVFWSAPDQGYIAVSPEFEDLSAFGHTPEEALAEMRTVLNLAIETYAAEGWPLPEPKALPDYSGQFRVRLPKSLHARLATQAAIEGVSLNTLVVSILSEGVVMAQRVARTDLSYAVTAGELPHVAETYVPRDAETGSAQEIADNAGIGSGIPSAVATPGRAPPGRSGRRR